MTWVSLQKLLQQAVGPEIYSHALRSGVVLPSQSKTKEKSETKLGVVPLAKYGSVLLLDN